MSDNKIKPQKAKSYKNRLSRADLSMLIESVKPVESAEKIVRKQNKYLGTILNSLNHPFFIIDANDYTIKKYNREACPDKLPPGTTCHQLTHGCDKPCTGKNHICPITQIKKTKKPVVVEHIHISGDGNTKVFEIYGFPIFNDAGEIVEIIEYLLDITRLKKTVESLWESEARLNSIFRAAPTGIGVECDRILLEINEKICQMTGYSSEELLGKDTRIFYSGDDDYEYMEREKYDQIRKNGIETVETRWKRKDGTLIDVLLSSTPIDRKDLSHGVTFTALDITKRKQADEMLRFSEMRLRALSEASFESIFFSEKGVCLDQNQTAERMFGYFRSEAIGRPGTEWITLEDRERVKINMLSGNEQPYDVKALHKDGTTFPAEIQARMINYKGHSVRVTALRDITKRKKAEEELKRAHDSLEVRVKERTADYLKANKLLKKEIVERKQAEKTLQESEQRYRTITEASLQGTYQVNAKGCMVFATQLAAELTGYSLEELNGLSLNVLFPPGETKAISDANIASLISGKSITGENTLTRKDGDRIEVSFSCAPVLDESGEYIGFIGSILDITKRKQTEEDLQESHSRLITEQVALRGKNVALKEILNQYESEKKLIGRQIQANISRFILPILGDIENGATENQKILTKTLKESLIDITSPFINQLENKYSNLSPRESEICKLIKDEYSSKEIASLLGLSVQTIHLRRKHIRKKLDITNQKINLSVYLESL